MSLNTGDQGYNNGKKYGQKGTLCGPNTHEKKKVDEGVRVREVSNFEYSIEDTVETEDEQVQE
jgi:hypothetical protein